MAAATPDPPDAQRPSRDLLFWLRATMLLAGLVPLLLFCIAAWALREQALAQARSQVDGAAAIAAEHAGKVFEVNATLLQRLAEMLGDADDAVLLAREEALHRRMVQMAAGSPQVQGLFVLGSDGRLIATNRVFPAPHHIDFSDRQLFRHHRDGGAQPFLSDVLTSRTTGEVFFDVSMRRERGGEFGGVLSASLLPAYFAEVYRKLPGADEGLHITLQRRADGVVLAGWPVGPTSRDAAAVPGSAASAGPRDDVLALRAARRIDSVPVQVVASMDLADALATWRASLAGLAGLMFPMAGVLIYVAFVAMRRTQRGLQVSRQLEAESRQRLQVEEALRKAQKLEAMGRLTGGVAHDFNNLLMIVSNNLYLLRHREPAVAGSPQLEAIGRAVKAGTQLTRQLLSFSRRQPLHPERIALPERMPEIVELLRPALGQSVAIDMRVAPDVAGIEVDAAELELAIVNLALNARDAMPAGGSIRIDARNDGPNVLVSMSDDGVGIEPRHLEHVFEPFFTTKPLGEGTGLGLSQVYGFCKRAGGSVGVRSEPGRGTTVSMSFPAVRAAAAGAVDSAVDLAALRGVRVLLVEDNPEVAATTRAVLASMGCVTTECSATQVLAQLAELPQRFDLMLSDVVMPGIDGIELAAALRARHPAFAVLLMSGYSQSLERAAALGLQVLPKPFTPELLAAAIAALRATPGVVAEAL